MPNRMAKRRIEKEEEFRYEIQRQLVNKHSSHSFPARTWRFVNSSFGIWFLTTIVVSIGTWVYTTWKSNSEREHQRLEAVRRLDVEITSRFYNAIMLSEAYPVLIKQQKQVDIIKELLQAPGAERMLIPEFANRNLRSLLYELSSLVSKEEREEIIKVLEGIEFIARDCSTMELSYEIAKDINSRLHTIVAERWNSDLLEKMLRETEFRFKDLLRYLEEAAREKKNRGN